MVNKWEIWIIAPQLEWGLLNMSVALTEVSVEIERV